MIFNCHSSLELESRAKEWIGVGKLVVNRMLWSRFRVKPGMTMFLIGSLVCGQAVAETKLNVVTTLGVLKYLTEQVGGEHVSVKALADPSQDPHFVVPRPTLMKKVREADALVEIGLSLELWAQKVVDGAGNSKVQRGQPGRISASAGIKMLEVPKTLSREFGDVHPEGNPHIWLDPLNAKKMAANIASGLKAVDGAHAAVFEQNLKAFEKQIDKAMENWSKKAAGVKNKQVVTYHQSWAYFSQRFGITVVDEIEEKPGIPPSARHRDALIKNMADKGVELIVMEPFYPRVAADFIAKKTGAKVAVVPIDVGTKDTPTYFALIDFALETLSR